MNNIEREALDRLVARHKDEFIELVLTCDREFKKHGGFLR